MNDGYRMKGICFNCDIFGKQVEGYNGGDDHYCPECNSSIELIEDYCESCNDIFLIDELNENGFCKECQYEADRDQQEFLNSVGADYKAATRIII